MRCPYCGADGTQVKDSRPTEDGASIRRRRVCLVCGGRFTTFERVQLRDLVVLKRNNRREPFSRDKLSRSVTIALRKRPVSEDTIERMVSGIVRQLESGGESEIAAETIGNYVMEALKTVDDVAYVRFASVYKNFREAKDFEAFVGELASTVGRGRKRSDQETARRPQGAKAERSAGDEAHPPEAEEGASGEADAAADDSANDAVHRRSRAKGGTTAGASKRSGKSALGEQIPLLAEAPSEPLTPGMAKAAGRQPEPDAPAGGRKTAPKTGSRKKPNGTDRA